MSANINNEMEPLFDAVSEATVAYRATVIKVIVAISAAVGVMFVIYSATLSKLI
jgi:hypothetical protein